MIMYYNIIKIKKKKRFCDGLFSPSFVGTNSQTDLNLRRIIIIKIIIIITVIITSMLVFYPTSVTTISVCFDFSWQRRVHAENVLLPIRVGILICCIYLIHDHGMAKFSCDIQKTKFILYDKSVIHILNAYKHGADVYIWSYLYFVFAML